MCREIRRATLDELTDKSGIFQLKISYHIPLRHLSEVNSAVNWVFPGGVYRFERFHASSVVLSDPPQI